MQQAQPQRLEQQHQKASEGADGRLDGAQERILAALYKGAIA